MKAAMARILGWMCAALLFAAVPARAGECDAAQQRPGAQPHAKNGKQDKQDKKDQPPAGREGPKKWWIDAELRRELGITDQQSTAIEQVWQRSLAQRAETRDRLDKADAVLQKMILDGADEPAFTAQLDRVEAARLEANKSRMLMLYRMNKQLTQDQRAKLDAKFKAMRERDGRRGGSGLR
jgi:Spy/CpxP family protein refolding chaperone